MTWASEIERLDHWYRTTRPDPREPYAAYYHPGGCRNCGDGPCYSLCPNHPAYYSADQERADTLASDAMGHDEWVVPGCGRPVRNRLWKRELVLVTTQADREAQAFFNDAAEDLRQFAARNLDEGGVCDFCCAPDRKLALYLAEPMVTEISGIDVDTLGAGSMTIVDDDQWGACPACCDAIERFRDDPVGLAAYVIENRDVRVRLIPYETEPFLRDALADTYRQLFDGGLHLADLGAYGVGGQPPE